MFVGSSSVAVTYTSDFAPVSSKEFLGIQVTIECGFTLKRVGGMTRTYSQVLFVRDFRIKLCGKNTSLLNRYDFSCFSWVNAKTGKSNSFHSLTEKKKK